MFALVLGKGTDLLFETVKHEPQSVTIVNKLSGKALEVENSSVHRGARIQQVTLRKAGSWAGVRNSTVSPTHQRRWHPSPDVRAFRHFYPFRLASHPHRSDRSLTVVRSVRWNSVEHAISWFDKALRVARLLPSFAVVCAHGRSDQLHQCCFEEKKLQVVRKIMAGYSQRKPLFDNLLHWPSPTSQKLSPTTENAA